MATVRRVRCAECGETFCVVGWAPAVIGDCPDCGPAWFDEIEGGGGD